MGRPSNEHIMRRKSIVLDAYRANKHVTIEHLKSLCVQQGLNTNKQTLEGDLQEIKESASDKIQGIDELKRCYSKLSDEIHYNQVQRDLCKTESGRVSHSRLIKELQVKLSELAITISQIEASKVEKATIVYEVRIGTFPEAVDPKKKVKEDDGNNI